MDRAPTPAEEQHSSDSQMTSIGAPVLSSTPTFAPVARPRTFSSLLRQAPSSSPQGAVPPYTLYTPDGRAFVASPPSPSTPSRRPQSSSQRSPKIKIRIPNFQSRNQEPAMAGLVTPPATPSSEPSTSLPSTPRQSNDVAASLSGSPSIQSAMSSPDTPTSTSDSAPLVNIDSLNLEFYQASPCAKLSFSDNNIAGIRSILPATDDDEPAFPYFRRLPAELRLKIWKYALPADRIVKIVNNDATKILFNRSPDGKVVGRCSRPYRVICTTPAVLHVCNESRTVGLKHYKLSFANRLQERPIYFDMDLDILFFDDTEALNRFTGMPFLLGRHTKKLYGDSRKIQNMVVGKAVTEKTLNLVGLYTGLKKLVLQEQWVLPLGRAVTYRSDFLEQCAVIKLGAGKKEGGYGLKALVSFQDEFTMRAISWSKVWRDGSFCY